MVLVYGRIYLMDICSNWSLNLVHVLKTSIMFGHVNIAMTKHNRSFQDMYKVSARTKAFA